MLRLPPTVALTVLASTTAPLRVVSPPLCKVTVLPALTRVLVWVVPCSLSLPWPWLALALKLRPPLLPKLMPTEPELLAVLLSWLAVLCAANSLILPSAIRLTVLPAVMLALCTVSVLPWPAPVARRVTLWAALKLLPLALPVLLLALLLLWLVPRLRFRLISAALAGSKCPALSVRLW